MFGSPKVKEKYVSLERAADALNYSLAQLQQYLITGQLVAAIIFHRPSDYRERTEVNRDDGSKIIHTRTTWTALSIVSPDHKSNPLMYLHPDDTARILLNKVPNRVMLVSRLFHDRTLSPKNGIGLLGDAAIAVVPTELVITSEELRRFAKEARVRILRTIERVIDLPAKHWYERPFGLILIGVLITVTGGLTLMKINELMESSLIYITPDLPKKVPNTVN